MLLGFSLSGFGPPIKITPHFTGGGCAAVAFREMEKISQKTHLNRPELQFRVSVRTCDEKNHQAYREVLKEMGYKLDPPWVRSSRWVIDAVRDEDEDLGISCIKLHFYTPPTEDAGEEKKKSSEITIISKIPWFPEEPKHYKKNIHQKVMERLKNSEAKTKVPVPSK